MYDAFLALVCAIVVLVIWRMHALESAREAAEAKAHALALHLRELEAELAACRRHCKMLEQSGTDRLPAE